MGYRLLDGMMHLTYLEDRYHNTFVLDYAQMCLQDNPPQHHRFENTRIPRHVTYAYARNATIARNDDFYEMPEGKTKTIDLLFLIANAPVPTQSIPESGSE